MVEKTARALREYKKSLFTAIYHALGSSFKYLENDLTFKAPGRMWKNRKTKRFHLER